MGAVLDEVALAYVLLSPRVKRTPSLYGGKGDPEYFLRPGAQLEMEKKFIRVAPSYQILSTIRSDAMRVRRFSYGSDLELWIALFGTGTAMLTAIGTFVPQLNNMTAHRKKADAEARLADAQAQELEDRRVQNDIQIVSDEILDMRTLEMSRREQEILLKSAAADLALKQEKIAQERLKTQKMVEGMSKDSVDIRRDLDLTRGIQFKATGGAARWPDVYVEELFDNNRLIGSVEAGSDLSPEFEVVDEDED